MELLDQLTQWTGDIASAVWGVPAVILLVGTGLYLTLRLAFIQFRGFPEAVRIVSGKKGKSEKDRKKIGRLRESDGETTPFQALCTSLSATIGTGNIAGVATAVVLGGPGAIFWMWVTALVGMATRFTASTLAVRYRKINPEGDVSGGPMYTLKYGCKMPKLAFVYAFLTLIASFGIGNTVQSNSIVGGLSYIIPIAGGYEILVGILLATFVGLVIIGGVKRIAHIAGFIVPFMALFYLIAALMVLVTFAGEIPAAFATIFHLAFNSSAAGGAAVGVAIQYGVARGVFSNEAGLGAATIVHATAKVSHPVKQGLVAMLGPCIDTLFICTLTGLVIVVTGSWGADGSNGLNGAALSAAAFSQGTLRLGIGQLGAWIVGIGLMFFAFSTMISWSYYGDRCAKFIFGDKAVLPYRIIFCFMVIVGASFPLQLVWNLADVANIFMALPNLVSLIIMASVVNRLQKDYFVGRDIL